jgi:hypothetical protein
MREIVHKVKDRLAIPLARLKKIRTVGERKRGRERERERVGERERGRERGRERERERERERAEYANGWNGTLRRYTQEQKTK